MKLEITNELGQIKLGNTMLPGIYAGCTIDGSVKLDEIDVPGQSGKSTQPKGFEDATISIRLNLINDDNSSAYDKAKIIINIFRAMDKNAKPYVYRIVNPMTNMWGIKEVIFKDLSTRDSNYDDMILADISLREYKPVVVKKEAAAPKPAKTTTNKKDTSASKGFAQAKVDTSPLQLSVIPKMQQYQQSKNAPFADNDQPKKPKGKS
jgi:hypothetical protein